MAENFQSYKAFFREFVISLFSCIAFGFITGEISGNVWLGFIIFIILIAGLSFVIFKKYDRIFKLIKSGASGYYYSYNQEKDSAGVYKDAGNSFYYLGVSGGSILEHFSNWSKQHSHINDYKFLLMNPEGRMLKKQVAFEQGVGLDTDIDSLETNLVKTIEEKTLAEKTRIQSSIKILKTLPAYKEGKLHIRLCDQFIPWWIYLFDEEKIYIGILEKGKRGYDSPLMVLKKIQGFSSPFTLFKNSWENMWAEADII